MIAAGSTDPDAYSNLAAALQAMGDIEGAVCGFQSALQISRGHAPSLAGLAGLLELAGDYDKGISILAPHLKQGTATPIMHVAYAQLLRRLDRGAEALRHLMPMAKIDNVDPAERAAVFFTLGDLLDETGEYERAFAAYYRANRLRGSRYSRPGREREVTRLMETFSKKNLENMPRSGRDTETPVFIVGMPRSGASTTAIFRIPSASWRWTSGSCGSVPEATSRRSSARPEERIGSSTRCGRTSSISG